MQGLSHTVVTVRDNCSDWNVWNLEVNGTSGKLVFTQNVISTGSSWSLNVSLVTPFLTKPLPPESSC